MANLTYYRFRNTLVDLRDCVENFDEPCSAEEHDARLDLIRVCWNIGQDFTTENGSFAIRAASDLPLKEAK